MDFVIARRPVAMQPQIARASLSSIPSTAACARVWLNGRSLSNHDFPSRLGNPADYYAKLVQQIDTKEILTARSSA